MCVPLPHEQDTNSADTAYGIACLTILGDRVKTPCRNGNEQHSNPAGSTSDMTLRDSPQHRTYLARGQRAAEFSHGLL